MRRSVVVIIAILTTSRLVMVRWVVFRQIRVVVVILVVGFSSLLIIGQLAV